MYAVSVRKREWKGPHRAAFHYLSGGYVYVGWAAGGLETRPREYKIGKAACMHLEMHIHGVRAFVLEWGTVAPTEARAFGSGKCRIATVVGRLKRT